LWVAFLIPPGSSSLVKYPVIILINELYEVFYENKMSELYFFFHSRYIRDTAFGGDKFIEGSFSGKVYENLAFSNLNIKCTVFSR
jgi:hypothetical protein